MPPAGAKTKFYSTPLSTSADDAKYRTKYKELKAKLSEIDEDNAKLQYQILKSKKSIQRLRLERAILYDRLQASETPSNPFSLHSTPHLAALVSSKDRPPSIREKPDYALEQPDKMDTFLKGMDANKLAAVQSGDPFASRTQHGLATSSGAQPSSTTTAAVTNGHSAPHSTHQETAQHHQQQHSNQSEPVQHQQAVPSSAVAGSSASMQVDQA